MGLIIGCYCNFPDNLWCYLIIYSIYLLLGCVFDVLHVIAFICWYRINRFIHGIDRRTHGIIGLIMQVIGYNATHGIIGTIMQVIGFDAKN